MTCAITHLNYKIVFAQVNNYGLKFVYYGHNYFLKRVITNDCTNKSEKNRNFY